ncbi:hypothetical protein CR513_14336, partial [Mucuna pruriens]
MQFSPWSQVFDRGSTVYRHFTSGNGVDNKWSGLEKLGLNLRMATSTNTSSNKDVAKSFQVI